VLLLEHPAVVTLGRGASEHNLVESPSRLAARGVELHRVGRGGDVTFHAPGQLVGYPIVDLAARDSRDVQVFLRGMEAALIDALEKMGVPARRIPGMTGVFVDRHRSARRGHAERKLASIGIGLRNWVTLHGFALNVSIDLAGFDAIVPCGLAAVEMSSVARELGCGTARSLPSLDREMRWQVASALREWLEVASKG